MVSPTATSAAPSASADPNRIRHEWYQTLTHVIVSIFARNVAEDKVQVDLKDAEVDVSIKLASAAEYQLGLSLFHKIVPAECKTSVGSAKVELKLKKLVPGKWDTLEGTGEA